MPTREPRPPPRRTRPPRGPAPPRARTRAPARAPLRRRRARCPAGEQNAGRDGARKGRALWSGSVGAGMRRIGVATRSRGLIGAVAVALGAVFGAQAGPSPAGASTLPTGFRDSVVLSGLTNPT